MMTDPIADMLTRIRNATRARKKDVLVPHSNLKQWIAQILADEGYVESVERLVDQAGTLRLVLKYDANGPAIRHIERVSTPGCRVYAPSNGLPRVLSDIGVAIVSTSQGVMTNKEARRRKLGGEILCKVY